MNSLNRSLSDLLNNQTNCDVHFTLQNDETIGAHSCILSARSPVFAAMLHHDCEESRTKVINAKDTDPDAFKMFLQLLYTGQLTNSMAFEIYADLYAIAHKYQVTDLALLENRMLTDTAPEDAAKVLVVADRFSRDDLKATALEKIKTNAVAFCNSPELLEFVKNSPDLCVLVLRRIVGVK